MCKLNTHQQICTELSALYERKNHDYNDSFAKFYGEFGLVSTCMRITDKLERLKSFVKNGEYHVADEKVEDTLMDLANYAIMTLVEMKLASEQRDCSDQKTHCPTCKHKEMPVDFYPCSDCFYGAGESKDRTYYEHKEEQP